MRMFGGIRLIPVVLLAAIALFALKASGIWFEGGYTLGDRLNRRETITVTTVPAMAATQLRSPSTPLDGSPAKPAGGRSWAQEMFNYPDVTGSVGAPRSSQRDQTMVTGSVGSAKEPPKEPEKPKDAAKDAAKPPAKDAKADAPQTKPAATPDKAPSDVAAKPDPRTASSAERAILERLLERRQELDARAREIELRENLLKAAEKKLEEKLAATKEKEGGPQGRKEEADAARFKGLVTMYETMKPKEAAKIFDRLDMRILTEVAGKINPRRMSEILAQMSPEAAEKLTVEFASRDGDRAQRSSDLPKIEGKAPGT